MGSDDRQKKLIETMRQSIGQYCRNSQDFDFSFDTKKPVVRLHEP